MREAFSDKSLRLAARMLRLVLKEPSERERIDAVAALARAVCSLHVDHPETWRKLTTEDAWGRPVERRT